MNGKTKFIIIILVTSLLLASGCTSAPKEDNDGLKSSKYPVKVQDKFGNNITFEEKPEKIVSLAPSNSKTLLSMGLEDSIVGVSSFHPPELENKSKIGSFKSFNVEKIIEMDPDVVFGVPGVQKERMQKLEKADIKVVTLGARDVEGIYENLEIVGKIMNKNGEADEVISDMNRSIIDVNDNLEGVEKKDAFFILWFPTMTAGNKSFIHDVLKKSGLRNVAEDVDRAFPVISEEQVIEKDPEIIIYSKHSNTTKKKIRNRGNWRTISAVKKGNLYEIEDSLINQPSPGVVKAIQKLARKSYPEEFQG